MFVCDYNPTNNYTRNSGDLFLNIDYQYIEDTLGCDIIGGHSTNPDM